MLPYLVLKRQRAELALEMMPLLRSRGGNRDLTPEAKERRHELARKIKALNSSSS
jgi:hypothetical protein